MNWLTACSGCLMLLCMPMWLVRASRAGKGAKLKRPGPFFANNSVQLPDGSWVD